MRPKERGLTLQITGKQCWALSVASEAEDTPRHPARGVSVLQTGLFRAVRDPHKPAAESPREGGARRLEEPMAKPPPAH